jgi:ribosomal protein L7/L12
VIWYWVAGIGAVALLSILSRRGERPDSGSRAGRSGGTPPTPAEIDALLRAGQKIEAIKMYRALHGVDLKAAKDAVDARARDLGR